MRRIKLFSVPISITSKSEALAVIIQWVMKGQGMRAKGQGKKTDSSSFSPHPLAFSPKIVTTPNPEMIVAAQKDPEFLKALQSADLAIPDGWGVVAAMRLLKGQGTRVKGQGPKEFSGRDSLGPRPLALSPSRISGISLMEDLIALAARRGWRVMLVGGKSGVAAKAAEKLRSGIYLPSRFTLHAISGPPDILHASPHDLDRLITSINKVEPDLLFVAFGHGNQEKWLHANRYKLNAVVAMGVGGALDQIVDLSLRPPAIIDSMGLGWLYRLIREPWRWRRQLALVKFVWMVIRSKLFPLA